MPLAQMIRRHASERPDHVALKLNDGQATYAQLDERTSRLARALSREGVAAEDRVAILDLNGPAQMEVAFATAKLRAVAVPVNFRLAPPEVLAILNDSESRVVLVRSPFVELLEGLTSELEHSPR